MSSGVNKNKDGKLCNEKENIMERWVEYQCELFDDAGRPDTIDESILENEVEDPPILMSELGCAIKEMKEGKRLDKIAW